MAAAAVVVRLPFVAVPAGADEAGFLQVAHQWSDGGGSLYGHYWVDRPPLLITLFQLADAAGGLVALRLLGCLSVAVTVLLCARTAGLVGGDRARAWAALAAAAMLVSPLLGSLEVNGELLAAPFVAAGFAALVQASQTREPRRAMLWAGLAGAPGMGALLVKQNILDVVVFALVFLLASSRSLTPTGVRHLALAAIAGGLGALAVVSAWTVAHGTSLVDVVDAMYPFRLRAAQAVAAGGSQYASGRGIHLVTAFLVSGTAALLVALLVGTIRARAWDPLIVALVAAIAYDTVSIALGGAYWLHYLVEVAAPAAVWTGVLVARGARGPRLATLVLAMVSAVGLAVTGFHPTPSSGQQVGASIGRVALPGDTLTTLYGEPEVNLSAGLSSPYQNLWSLPTKANDPSLVELDAVLSGPAAPTWLVVIHDVNSWGLDTARTQALIDDGYRPVARIAGQTLYLHDGVTRAIPWASTPEPSGL